MTDQNDIRQETYSQNLQENSKTDHKQQDKAKKFLLQGKTSFILKEQSNNIKTIIYFSLIGLTIANTFAVQQQISQEQYGELINDTFATIQGETAIYLTFFCGAILLKILLILSVGLEIVYEANIFGLTWVTKKIIQSFAILKQFDLCFSAFMAVINWQQNMALFLVSCLINILQVIYLQNYIIRKDHLYIASSYHHLLFRSIIILTYFGNIAIFSLGNETLFYLFYLCLGSFHFVWYLRKGNQLFMHRFASILFLILNALFFTLYVGFTQKFILDNAFINYSHIFKHGLVFVVVILLLYLRSFLLRGLIPKQNSSSPKQLDILFKNLLESFFDDKDIDSNIIGVLQMHQISQHDGCSMINQSLYDPFLKNSIRQQDKYVQKHTLMLYYIKELYQKRIQLDDTADNIIDYCEFLCNEYNHPYLALKWTQKAKLHHMDIMQLVKISKIKNFIADQNAKLNQELNNGSLQIESILVSQDSFGMIETLIRQYIIKNINIWKSLRQQQMQLSQLRISLRQQFQTLIQIQRHWKQISKFFDINKAWLFIYFHYMLFIKNQKIKQKQADIFSNNALVNEEYIFSNKTIYLATNSKEKQLFNPAIMYNQDSCCITAVYEAGELIICRANKRFIKASEYEEEEIIGCNVEVLMQPNLALVHSNRFIQWLQEGYVLNENSYQVHSTTIIAKDGRAIPVFKYYKAHVTIQRGLEFVCLLKINLRPTLSQTNNMIRSSSVIRSRSERNNYINGISLTKEFANNQISHTLMENNIFIKEQSLQPNPTFIQIQSFKLYSRIFTFLILASILILSKLTEADSSNLKGYSDKFITFMSMYRYPVILGTNYMKQFLNIGNMTKVNAQIQSATNSMIAIASSKSAKMTLFDNSLNPDNIYYPFYNYSFLLNDSLTGIDLFYTLVSCISSLSQPSIDRTSQQFQRFNSYFKPSYDTMMNATKYKLHEVFGDILTQSIAKQISFFASQIALFFIFVTILFLLVQKFLQKMKNILEISLKFNSYQTKIVYKYWKKIENNFDKLFLQLYYQKQSLRQSTQGNISTEQESKQVQVIKRQVKQESQNKERRIFELKLRLTIVIIMTIIISITSSIELNMMSQFRLLQQFESDGFFFLKYFPAGPIVAMGCVQKYYSQQYPLQLAFKPQRYQDVLLAVFKFGYNNPYIGDVTDSSSTFYLKQKNYFFGSPCEYNPSILTSINITVQKCLKICNGTFKQGLSTFLRYAHTFGSKYISNQFKATSAQLDQLTLGTTVLSSFVLDAMATWSNQFTQKMVLVQSTNFNSCLIVLGVVILIHLLVTEYKLVGFFNKQYDFSKKMYQFIVPEFILIKEKVIRQKFVIQGIISP